jgi:hypothetical protein
LGTNTTGSPINREWDYPSVIGMLLYLTNTRPDIQFATHQCARFAHCPRETHADYLIRICRYLKGTAHQGISFIPELKGPLRLDCYVDADFAGLFHVEDGQDPACVKSRTGYCMFLGQCPVVWASRLQKETSLSTLEAEYIALSTAMHQLLPLRQLVLRLAQCFGQSTMPTKVISKVFEDNNGCLSVAKAPHMTPRTKYIGCKYHFFKEKIGPGTDITLQYIKSADQVADIFTKGLPIESFHKLRRLLMGW